MNDNLKSAPQTRKFQVYSPEEIIAAGGAEKFARYVGHDPRKVHETPLPGEPLSEREHEEALHYLTERKRLFLNDPDSKVD